MKKLIKIFAVLIGVVSLFTHCDKVKNAYEPVQTYDLDTTLYPGVWQDYVNNDFPNFTENTNTDANVLIEDYTGHLCINCPPAGQEAHSIEEAHPGRVFVASIHVDPGAILGFQTTLPPPSPYTHDFTNPDGIAYGIAFQSGFNFTGNPSGTVNRKTVSGNMFDQYGAWATRTSSILSANDLKVNIQSVFNYFSQTDGGYLHVEVEKKTNDPVQLNTVVYVVEDSVVSAQKLPDNSDDLNYVHRDIHLGSIDNRPWGRPTFDADASAGDKKELDYSYKLPTGIAKDNLHFLIYVYDKDTYEILQVIRQDIHDMN